MATGKGFIEIINNRKRVSMYELFYYRLLCLLFALTYILTYNLDFLNTSSSVEFIVRRDIFAAIPISLFIVSFLFPIVRKNMAHLMGAFFTLATLYMIGYFYINDFRTHYEIIILTLIFFSNLHFNRILLLVLYNVIVLAALEGIYLIGDAASKTNPVYAFMLVLVVMLICMAYQIYRIRFREAISEREKMLSSINDQMPDAWIIFNRDTLRAFEANQKAVSIFGFNDSDSIDKFTLEQLIVFDNVYSDLFTLVAEADNGTFIEKECVINTKSAEPYYASLTLKTIKGKPDIVYAKFNNINSFKQLQVIQENRQERYISMLENISEGIIVVSQQGELVFFNKRVGDILGLDKQNLIIGRKLFEVLGDDLMLKKEMSIELNDGTLVDLREKRLVNHNNQVIWIRLTGSAVSNEKGKIQDIIWVLTDITAYIKKEELSSENEEGFRKIFEESELGMSQVSEQNTLIRVNNAFVNTLEYSKDELGNFLLPDLLHPDDVLTFQANMDRLLRGIMPHAKFECRFITKSGITVWTNCSLSSIRNRSGNLLYIIVMTDDITKAKMLEKALSESRSNLHAVVENTSDAILGIDLSYQINVINSQSKKFFAEYLALDVGLHESLKSKLSGIDQITWLALIETVMRKGVSEKVEDSFELNGQVYHFETFIHPVIGDMNQTVGVSCFTHDITQRVINEKELAVARQTAEKATEEKSRFLATMSHEIRTPLNGLLGMSDILKNTSLNAEQVDYLNSIQLSGEALLTIINDVLDYSKIESGMMELESVPFRLSETIEETIHIIGYKAREKGLSINSELANDLPDGIVGDKNRLRQILMNLLSNSIKFTKEGSIDIKVSLNQEEGEQLELKFCVKDTGIGINAAQKEKLFKEFSQADVSTSRQYGGSGLGLSICARLVRLMNGKIWVESEPGLGSEFYFTIRTSKAEISDRITLPKTTKQKLCVFGSSIPEYILQSVTSKDDVKLYSSLDEDIPKELGQGCIVIMQATFKPSLLRSFIEKIRQQWHDEVKVYVFGAPSPDPADYIYGDMIDAIIDESSWKQLIADHSENVKGSNGIADSTFASIYPIQILVAEDNAINKKLVDIILKQLGYKATLVDDGSQALELVSRQTFDLILMDVQMPLMDGLESTQAIRTVNITKQPLIAAMTAFALEGDKQRCLDAGMDDYISKPIAQGDIRNLITKHFKPVDMNKNNQRDEGGSKEVNLLDEIAINRLLDINAKVDSEFLNQVLQMYEEQAPSLIKEMEIAFEKDNLEMVWKAAHKLKGSSLNMGAQQVSILCRAIETDGKESVSKNMRTNINQLSSIYEKTILELKKLVVKSS